MKRLFLIVLTIFFLSSCTSEVISPYSLFSYMNRLNFAEYEMEGIFFRDSSWRENWKIGERIIVYSATVTFKAGIDMNKFNCEKDMKVDEETKTVSIELPYPELFEDTFSMGDNAIKQRLYKVTGWRHDYSAKEIEELKKESELGLRKKAAETDIVDRAKNNARSFFVTKFKTIGYNCNVSFKYDSPTKVDTKKDK